MTGWLKRIFALSEQGAKDLNKAIWCYTITNLSLLLPMCLIYILLRQWILPLMGISVQSMGIWVYIGLSLIILVIIYGLEYLQLNSSFLASYSESAARRISIAEKLRKLPLSFFGERDLSDLTTTILSDCADMEKAFSRHIPELFGAVFSIVPVAVALLIMDWRMGLALLWVAPVAFLLCISTKKLQERYSKKHKEATLDCANGIQECIDNIKDIRANDMNIRYMQSLDDKLDHLETETVKSEAITGMCVTASQMILKLGIATTVVVGGTLLTSGSLDFMTFLVFLVAASRIFEPLSGALGNLAAVFNTMLQVERTREITEYPVQNGSETAQYNGYDINFDNVAFAYKTGETVLKDVSFTAKQGEITALVGPSGGGKSTAIKLAARFWDPSKGKISLGGVDLTSVDPETYLKNFSIVFQDVTLFNNTVMENIRLGRSSATDEEVMEAAKAACCQDFIERLPDGYQTMIGENGSTLSGGERQRLSIARALLKDAPVILLDEATASLDPENEGEIQKAIAKLVEGKTVIMIAHRLRTVVNANQILVLADGTVVEHGTHKELLAHKGLYEKLYHIQQESQNWSM